MLIRKKINTLPYWTKGTIIGLSIYTISVSFSILIFILANGVPQDFFPPGSLGFVIPFFVISFYPGILLKGYEAIGLILIFNTAFYTIAGSIIGYLVGKKKQK
jgi:hypothetical protein